VSQAPLERLGVAELTRTLASRQLSSVELTKHLFQFFPHLEGKELVIEAATESAALKFKIFADLDRLAPAAAILATNTSSLSIARIAEATRRPSRVVGMHFFNPVHIMKLVEIVTHGGIEGSTENTVLGPFYVEGAPEMSLGANIAKPGTPGDACHVWGRILGADGKPVAGAIIDVWEGAGDGFYDVQKNEGTNLRARFRTGADGRYDLHCVRPVSYPVPNDGPVGKLLVATGRHPMRPGHLHFMIQAPGHATLVTHLFTKGDQYLDSDAVFGVKESLIVDFRKGAGGEYEASFDFVLKADKQARRAA